MAKDILTKLKKINKTEYNFNELQTQIFNLLMEGNSTVGICKELNIKNSIGTKEVKAIKEITGLDNEDLKYIRAKKRELSNKLDVVEQECKRQIGELIAPKYLGITDTKKYPPIMYIRISGLRKKYSYKAIFETVKRCQPSLDYVFQHKKFEDINHKLSYIFVVIKNNIDKVYKDIQLKEKQTKIKEKEVNDTQLLDSIVENKKFGATKRRDFSDFLDNL